MDICIHNKCFQYKREIDGVKYSVTTYVGGKYHSWGTPWVVWVSSSEYWGTIYEEEIPERTLEAAEAAHKRVVANIEQIVREHDVSY